MPTKVVGNSLIDLVILSDDSKASVRKLESEHNLSETTVVWRE